MQKNMYGFNIPQYQTINNKNFIKHDLDELNRNKYLGAITSKDMQRQHFRLGYEPASPGRFEQHYINWRSPTPAIPAETKMTLQLNKDPIQREATP